MTTTTTTTVLNVSVANFKTIKFFVETLQANLKQRPSRGNGTTWKTCRDEGIGFLKADDMTVKLVIFGTDTFRKHTVAALQAFTTCLNLDYVTIGRG
jgi:hypothetical protein